MFSSVLGRVQVCSVMRSPPVKAEHDSRLVRWWSGLGLFLPILEFGFQIASFSSQFSGCDNRARSSAQEILPAFRQRLAQASHLISRLRVQPRETFVVVAGSQRQQVQLEVLEVVRIEGQQNLAHAGRLESIGLEQVLGSRQQRQMQGFTYGFVARLEREPFEVRAAPQVRVGGLQELFGIARDAPECVPIGAGLNHVRAEAIRRGHRGRYESVQRG